MKTPSVMVNLLGAEGYTGQAVYDGLDKCLATEGVKIHFYGKEITKPFRKMGHATVLDDDIEKAKEKGRFVLENLKIRS
jgi:5-(carboxyamino)imidazole ribonucleotide synthase